MNEKIPTEVYLAFLDRTIPIHWELHALLMTLAWLVLVPIGVVAVRFFKTRPRPFGIDKRGLGSFHPKLLCWTIHYIALYGAIALSLAGLGMAMLVSGGFSGSMHAVWGIATVAFGCLQIVSAWFRGTHGGRYAPGADPNDASTWHGDHFDMTPRRRWFEAYHKTSGYFALVLALGAVTSGLFQFWMPSIALALALALAGLLFAFVWLEGRGFRHDTYHSVYGTHPSLPYNKARAIRLNGTDQVPGDLSQMPAHGPEPDSGSRALQAQLSTGRTPDRAPGGLGPTGAS